MAINASSLEEWADREFNAMLQQERLSGAAISVVDKKDTIFSRAYGYADYRTKKPMNTATTRVRVCSNTKVFVATALMQLLEQGHIASLNDPANKYLTRIQLPRFKGKDITIRDLVTHRGGFEDSYFNAGTDKQIDTPLSAEVIQKLLPEVVREPGTLSVYSNANSALQGVLIEDVSGLDLKDYLARYIFTPLGMNSSVLNDNPPVPQSYAQPYALFTDGSSTKVELIAKHPLYAASGGIYSTTQDMSRFVRAHLNAGRGQGHSILSPESFAMMHQVISRNHPSLSGIGVQFFVDDINGERVLSHGCGLPGFSSYLGFLPERDIGFFISVLSKKNKRDTFSSLKKFFSFGQDNVVKARRPAYAAKFFYGFLKHFIGFPEADTYLSLSREELARYTGTYRLERRNHTSMLAALDLLVPESATVRIAQDGEGGLMINGKSPFLPLSEHVFQRGGHPSNKYAFDMDANDKAVRAMRLAAVPATRTQFWNNPLLMNELLTALVVVCSLGVGTVFFPVKSRVERLASGLPAFFLLSFILVMLALFFAYEGSNTIEEYVNTGYSLRLFLIALGCNLVALVTCVMMCLSVRVWQQAYWGDGIQGVSRRLLYSGLTAAGLGLTFIFYHFNLLGFQLP